MTTIDHDLELPTKSFDPDRKYQGQHFCHHVAKDAKWKPWRLKDFEFRDTGINTATVGLASVHVARILNESSERLASSHDADILFTFIMNGSMELAANKYQLSSLKAGDAYVIPPGLQYELVNISSDLELLEVSLPGNFKTIKH